MYKIEEDSDDYLDQDIDQSGPDFPLPSNTVSAPAYLNPFEENESEAEFDEKRAAFLPTPPIRTPPITTPPI